MSITAVDLQAYTQGKVLRLDGGAMAMAMTPALENDDIQTIVDYVNENAIQTLELINHPEVTDIMPIKDIKVSSLTIRKLNKVKDYSPTEDLRYLLGFSVQRDVPEWVTAVQNDGVYFPAEENKEQKDLAPYKWLKDNTQLFETIIQKLESVGNNDIRLSQKEHEGLVAWRSLIEDTLAAKNIEAAIIKRRLDRADYDWSDNWLERIGVCKTDSNSNHEKVLFQMRQQIGEHLKPSDFRTKAQQKSSWCPIM